VSLDDVVHVGTEPAPELIELDRALDKLAEMDERKAKAVACYPSQLLALEDDWELSKKLEAPAPEQYWKLAPPPEGWERLADQG